MTSRTLTLSCLPRTRGCPQRGAAQLQDMLGSRCQLRRLISIHGCNFCRLSAGPCCKKGCYAAFLDDPDKNQAVIEWRAMLDLKGVDDRRTFLYDMLMRMYKDTMSMFTSSSYFLIKGLWVIMTIGFHESCCALPGQRSRSD